MDIRSASTRQRVGRAMTVLAAGGVLLAVAGMIAGWFVTSDLHRGTKRSLDVTIESLDSVDRNIGVAETVLTSATATLGEVGQTINSVVASFAATNELAASVEGLSTTLAPALEDTTSTLRQLEDVGNDVDVLLGTISSLPIGPSYRPDPGLGPTFGAMASELEPLAQAVRDTANRLGDWQRSSDELDQDLRALAATVTELNRNVSASGALLPGYRTNVEDARRAAIDARDDLNSNLVVLRLLVLAGGVFVAASQVVPWWLGRELLEDPTAAPARGRSAGATNPLGDTPD